MTDAEFRKERARAKKFFENWVWMLGFRTWHHTEIEYWREPLGPLRGREDEDGVAIATCEADWRYLTLCMKIDLTLCLGKTDHEVETTIVHELCHGLVNEMRDWDINHEERCVTELAQAFLWVRNITAGAKKK